MARARLRLNFPFGVDALQVVRHLQLGLLVVARFDGYGRCRLITFVFHFVQFDFHATEVGARRQVLAHGLANLDVRFFGVTASGGPQEEGGQD